MPPVISAPITTMRLSNDLLYLSCVLTADWKPIDMPGMLCECFCGRLGWPAMVSGDMSPSGLGARQTPIIRLWARIRAVHNDYGSSEHSSCPPPTQTPPSTSPHIIRPLADGRGQPIAGAQKRLHVASRQLQAKQAAVELSHLYCTPRDFCGLSEARQQCHPEPGPGTGAGPFSMAAWGPHDAEREGGSRCPEPG